MPLLDAQEITRLIPRLISVVGKVIKFSKQGWTKEEKREIAEELVLLAADLLKDVVD